MHPRRLTLQGVTRFHDSISLDLDQLPDGLVAVAGPNGSGKTTIMESMACLPLFLELPSRPGHLRDRVNRRDAFVELIHDYAGRTWRHLVQIDPGTGRSGARLEAYLWEAASGADASTWDEEGAWLPVDGYPTPGRVTDYREALNGLGFPDQAVFLAGAFAVHTGAGNFLELTTAERRELFVSMLGIEGYQRLADRAKDARKPLDAALGELQELEADLARDRETAAELDAEIKRLESGIQERAGRVQGLEVKARKAGDQVATARAELGRLEDARRVVLERIQEIRTKRDTVADELKDLEAKISADESLEARQAEIERRSARLQELTKARAGLLGERAGHKATWEAAGRELQQARQELGRHGETRKRLEAELEELAKAAARLDDLGDQVEDLTPKRERRQALGRELAEAKAAAAKAEGAHREAQGKAPSVDAAEALVGRLERDAELLDGVPCGGRTFTVPSPDPGHYADTGPTRVDCGACQFLVQARQASGELPDARKALESAKAQAEDLARLYVEAQERRARVSELDAERETLDQELRRLETLEAEAARLRDRLERRDQVTEDLEANRERGVELTATLIPELEERQAKARQAMEAVDAKGREIRTELDGLEGAEAEARRLALALDRLPERRQAREVNRERHARAVEALEGAKLPPEPAEARQRLAEAEAEAVVARDLVASEREELSKAREGMGHAKGRRAELGDLEARAKALEASRAALARRRAGFRELERALGRTGIQALEIDAAGPTVARLTNDLLSATFGGRFAVRLDTIREASRGRKQRETFDLTVLDGNREAASAEAAGLAADVSELSKGEKVLVDEALKLGIAMFHAQRSGAQLGTLWRDECDTGLDPENRRRYPAMLRRALEAGGLRRLYFVSHDPDVQAQADGVIRVSAEGSVSMEAR